ncbi:unnamed protein product [Darwinula stevensoni]|uniref:threonine--tRNA ligase n=1 Tax=Darwinula stevensoni TaxID=69355 RepID=A0A7R9AHF2_9CRUS|nr:unnamed protein product [Darwinula stevensoni]CAG0904674.1 unnamed protein product [Darwinula stevensoni]
MRVLGKYQSSEIGKRPFLSCDQNLHTSVSLAKNKLEPGRRPLRHTFPTMSQPEVAGKESKTKHGHKGGGETAEPPRKELQVLPAYIQPAAQLGASSNAMFSFAPQDRINLWNKYKERYIADLASKAREKIEVNLPDGKVVEGVSWDTTPYKIAAGISQGLADNAVIAKVNGVLWDLDRPLEGNCSLEILKFDNEEGQQVFWHSSAHVLGEAMERVYGGWLCYGPPIENGFYYDMFIKEEQVSPDPEILIQGEISRQCLAENALNAGKKCKKGQNNEKIMCITAGVHYLFTFRCGPLIDLCLGPHVRHTGKIKAFKVVKNSSSYWEGKSDRESLQRVYGISFPDTKQLKEWERFQEEAAKRDHRRIGRDQELFFFHELSPGSCFFNPRGAHIYNTLIDLIKSEYRRRGFQEVMSPNIYNSKLWEISGHWQHYAENMFLFESEKEQFALKPMNCPGHCLMFDHRPRSWRELPLRLADFGVLHRNELSGALSGLTRVRRFQQDDAHIFCAVEQIKDEISSGLEFLDAIYTIFGFTFELKLSTRPQKFLGDIKDWDEAEKELAEGLNKFGKAWKLNPEDGAFYGPKIDITIMDALRREHQCATLQLDFQLPRRFNLSYVSESGEKKRPVIIHRAILGSVERLVAVLTENYGGKWPFWLSPRQSIVIPVAPPFDEYALQVKKEIWDAGFQCEVDIDPGDTLNKKIRNAQLSQCNFILVVGEKEKSSGTVNVRTRDNKVHGERSIADVVARFRHLQQTKIQNSEEEF